MDSIGSMQGPYKRVTRLYIRRFDAGSHEGGVGLLKPKHCRRAGRHGIQPWLMKACLTAPETMFLSAHIRKPSCDPASRLAGMVPVWRLMGSSESGVTGTVNKNRFGACRAMSPQQDRVYTIMKL